MQRHFPSKTVGAGKHLEKYVEELQICSGTFCPLPEKEGKNTKPLKPTTTAQETFGLV